MKVLYNLSFVNRSSDRVMVGANQGRYMHESREACEAFLMAFLENNGAERLESIYGAQAMGTFRVDAFECYDHGDALSIYVRTP